MRIAIVTVSTRAAKGVYTDRSGDILVDAVHADGHDLVHRSVLPDDRHALTELLRSLCDDGSCDVVITTGGTGISPTDATPEATLDIGGRVVPGIGEAIRAASLTAVPAAMLSRGVAVVRQRTLVVNLPGSPGGARDGWAVVASIAEHAVAQLAGHDHTPSSPEP